MKQPRQDDTFHHPWNTVQCEICRDWFKNKEGLNMHMTKAKKYGLHPPVAPPESPSGWDEIMSVLFRHRNNVVGTGPIMMTEEGLKRIKEDDGYYAEMIAKIIHDHDAAIVKRAKALLVVGPPDTGPEMYNQGVEDVIHMIEGKV